MGIEQACKWGVYTLNKFRRFMGLKKFESSEEWWSVSDVAVRFVFLPFIPWGNRAAKLTIRQQEAAQLRGSMAILITSSCMSVCGLRPNSLALVQAYALCLLPPTLSCGLPHSRQSVPHD